MTLDLEISIDDGKRKEKRSFVVHGNSHDEVLYKILINAIGFYSVRFHEEEDWIERLVQYRDDFLESFHMKKKEK